MSLLNNIFLQNLQALRQINSPLVDILQELEIKNISTIKDEKGLNFIFNGTALYENPKEDLLNRASFFKQNFNSYPVLYFYGLGNSMLYKLLLENDNLKHLVVFEDNLELIKLCLSLFDFSEQLIQKKLILLSTDENFLYELVKIEDIVLAYELYELHVHSDFYMNFFADKIKSLNFKLTNLLKNSVFYYGTSADDGYVGIENSLANLDTMLENFVFKNFLKDNKFSFKTAIIVATGPSLDKQLPLLKSYHKKAIIFCLDSSYKILHKHGIKPDIVLSLERVKESAEFFNNDYKEFDENTVFVVSALTHPNTVKYLKEAKRDFMLVLRPLHFHSSLKLDEYGYLADALSVANMAFELAASLRFENIILIGQDLAYAQNKSSHSEDYMYKSLHKNDYERDENLYKCEAYGGLGVVQSSLVWTLFRQSLQKDASLVSSKLNIKVFNATQGGARIKACIEKPFKECCEELLSEDLDKRFFLFKNDSLKISSLKKQTKKRIKKIYTSSKHFLNIISKIKDEDFENLELLMLKFRQSDCFNEFFMPSYFAYASKITKLKVFDLKLECKKEALLFFAELAELLSKQNALLKRYIEG